jgi:hypothetical protein
MLPNISYSCTFPKINLLGHTGLQNASLEEVHLTQLQLERVPTDFAASLPQDNPLVSYVFPSLVPDNLFHNKTLARSWSTFSTVCLLSFKWLAQQESNSFQFSRNPCHATILNCYAHFTKKCGMFAF